MRTGPWFGKGTRYLKQPEVSAQRPTALMGVLKLFARHDPVYTRQPVQIDLVCSAVQLISMLAPLIYVTVSNDTERGKVHRPHHVS
jgi:hypothetical protein